MCCLSRGSRLRPVVNEEHSISKSEDSSLHHPIQRPVEEVGRGAADQDPIASVTRGAPFPHFHEAGIRVNHDERAKKETGGRGCATTFRWWNTPVAAVKDIGGSSADRCPPAYVDAPGSASLRAAIPRSCLSGRQGVS
jgi:hypothetical protein